jgi:hypothetical protein
MLASFRFVHSHLVTQIVPKALLDMSREKLRAAFANVISKRICTLRFDRSSPESNDRDSLEKLFIKYVLIF